MTNNKKVISVLNELMQVDIDAVNAYGQAIDNIEENTVRARVMEFQRDHERHINDLAQLVRKLGGTPVERKRDFKGFLIEGFTAIRSAIGTQGAIKAMKTNEELTNRSYDKALKEELPEEVRELVARNREDERRHLQFMEDVISGRYEMQAGLGSQPHA